MRARRSPAGPISIAFINSWYVDPALGSGTAVAIRGLASGLRALGHQVTLLEPRGDLGASLRRRLAFNIAVRGRLRRNPYSLVVGFDIDGLLVARRDAPRYVVSLKGIAADERLFERGLAQRRLRATALLEGRNARRATRVIVTSRYARDRAVVAYGLESATVGIVPEGIPFAFWGVPAERSVSPRPTIVSVARFYPRKSLGTLVAAMVAIRAAIPDVQLRLVGSGPEEPSLRAQAASLGLDGPTVEFLGAESDPVRVRAVLQGADVFCLPSLQEGFGIAFLEAMAGGLPIVACDAGAVPEVVPHGEVGHLVPPRDVTALAGALIRLLEDPPLRARLGEQGRRRAASYDWPIVAARFLEATIPNGAEV